MFLECDAILLQLDMAHKAKECRRRLTNPPNSVQDRPLSLKKPTKGITGLEARKIAQEAAARAEEARRRVALDSQLKLNELRGAEAAKKALALTNQIVGQMSKPGQDWLLVSSNSSRANSFPQNFLHHIKQVVARQFGLTSFDMDANVRTKIYFTPRHIAWYLSRIITLKSLPEIGRAFGGRHHTSILNACRRIPHRMLMDADLCQTIVELQVQLQVQLERWRAQECRNSLE